HFPGFPLSPWGSWRSMKLHSIAAAGALALSALAPIRSSGQVPTQGQAQLPGGLPTGMTPDQLAQLLQQNPQLGSLIRQRLQQSGLTPDQVRAQLSAAGYPPNLLDAYLSQAQPGQATPQPSAQTLEAIQALGLSIVTPAGESLPVDTGFIRARAEVLHAESLATGNYVFGVDVFRRTTTQFLPLLSGPVPPDYRL